MINKPIFLIALLLMLTGCSLNSHKVEKEIIKKTYEYASKEYDNNPVFSEDNSNIEIYDDNNFYYILLTTETGKKDTDAYIVFDNEYRISKKNKNNISDSDFEILSNKSEVVDKNFVYEEKNIDLHRQTY